MDDNLDSGDNSENTGHIEPTAEEATPERAAEPIGADSPTEPPKGTPPGQPAGPTAGAPVGAPVGPPAGPTVVTRAGGVLRGIAGERYLAALVGAGVIYVAAWLLSLIFTVLAFVAAADASPDWGLAFAVPAQVVGLAVAGTLTAGATVMGISASVSVLWLPLLVTAFIVVASAFVARRDERIAPSASRGIRWLLSGVTGLTLAILVVVIAAVTSLRYALGDGASSSSSFLSGAGTASSASFTAFLGAVALGTVVSYLARARVAQKAKGAAPAVVAPASTSVFAAVRSTLPVVGLHFAVLAALVTVALLIWAVVNSGVGALLTAFFWLPTAVLAGLGLVNLVPVTLTGGLTSLAGMGGVPTSFWLPGSLPGWVTVLVTVVNLALIVVTGIVLRLRRAQLLLSPAMSWVTTIVSFAVAGIAISVLGGIAAWTSVNTGGAGESLNNLLGGAGSFIESAAAVSGSLGLAAWAFIVFAVLGAIVETVATFVAPVLVQLVPLAVLSRTARITGAIGVPFAVPGTFVAPQPVAAASAGAAAGAAATDVAGTTDGVAAASATGAAVPAAPGDTTAAQTVTPALTVREPMTPAKKRRLRIILSAVAGGVVVVLGASIAITVVNQTAYGPEHQVASYLDAVIAGDASAAIAIGDVNASKAQRVLLTDDVLKATKGRISGYTITDVSVTGDLARVTATTDQDGEKDEATYTLRKSGKTALVFDQWTLDPVSLPTMGLTFSEGITELDVNGVAVKLTSDDLEQGYLNVLAFAGDYVVGSGGDDEWLAAKPQNVHMGLSESSSGGQLKLEPTAKFTTTVDKQVADLLAACVAQKSLQADDCPIYTYDYGTITDVVWTIDEPAVTALDNLYDGEWYVSTDKRGSATVTYTNTGYSGEAKPKTDTVAFSVNGTVKLVDGAPVFSYGY